MFGWFIRSIKSDELVCSFRLPPLLLNVLEFACRVLLPDDEVVFHCVDREGSEDILLAFHSSN